MPNYNNAPFLREAIDSILNQTLSNFILLIIDDGSSDDSIKIINSYSDKRIHLIQKEQNTGIVDALNIGLKKITTKYIVRMDGDDLSINNRLELLYKYMENNPEIGVCGSNIETFGSTSEIWNYSTDRNKIKARLIFNAGVGHASCIYRTEILTKNDIFYSKKHPYMEDYDLFLKLKNCTEFGNIPLALYKYRILSHNSTVKNRSTILDRYRNIYTDVLEELGIETKKENIEKHLDFFINPNLSFKIKEYKKWLDFLILQNRKTEIYPQKALEDILEDRWDIFFFKIVPMSINKNIEYFKASKKISVKKLSYLLKLKINTLIGRK